MTPEQWRRLKELFAAAEDQPPEARDRFLGEACGSDHELRAQLESMLRYREMAHSSFLEDPIARVPKVWGKSAERDPAWKSGRLVADRFVIEALLGLGGMGEVYRALDKRLNRTVAIKTLPAHLVQDSDLRLRLRREARAVSALSHPHICSLYDLESEGDSDFLVMEYVEGETLASRLRSGALPFAEWSQIAVQVSSALVYAHQQGVVHRDLKPGNIILAATGPKLLDFGLAKQSPLGAPTSESLLFETEEGAILGTVAYMSPEQAEGKPVDVRSDVFSFGCVLYEMVTGWRAFEGSSPVSILAAILHEEPRAVRELAPLSPPGIEQLIAKCLHKTQEGRFQRMEDVKSALLELNDKVYATKPSSETSMAQPRTWGVGGRWIVAVAAVVLVIAAFALSLRKTNRSGQAEADGGGLTLLASIEGEAWDPALSPDGKMIAYVKGNQGSADLYVARTAGGEPVRLTNDQARESAPRFSPDGERIVFTRVDPETRKNEIWVVPAFGGKAARILTGAADAAWSADGTRLAFVYDAPHDEALATAAADGSNVHTVLQSDAVYSGVRHPSWSPDGSQIAIVRSAGGASGELWLVPSKGGRPRRLAASSPGIFCDYPVFTPDGRSLVYHSNRAGTTNLWMLSLSGGDSVRLTTGPGPDYSPTLARDGSIAFVNFREREALILLRPAIGQAHQLLTHPGFLWAPAFSQDGRDLAYSRAERDGEWHIWSVPVLGGEPQRLTSGPVPQLYPRFTSDGGAVLYHTWTAEKNRIWRVPRNGGPTTPLTPADEDDQYCDMSPDGQSLAFARTQNNVTRIFIAPANGPWGARPLTQGASTLPHWSPDGGWIAFSPGRGFGSGIFVIRPDGTGLRRLSERGSWPVWWPGGQSIAFLAIGQDGLQEIRRVDFSGGPSKQLRGLHFHGTNAPFDISRDGSLIATSDLIQASSEIWLLKPRR